MHPSRRRGLVPFIIFLKMSFPEEYVTLYLRLLRAAEKDDTRELYILHEQNSLLLHGPSLWGENENPLHVACKHGSVRFVIEVLNLNPGLARRRRNSDGFSPMHVASANGHVEIVQVLADFDSKLCLVEDIEDRVPLHVAAMKGKGDVVRALVHACPESLRKLTCRGETALHLALKNHQTGAFIVLLEEIQKWKQEELLNWKDIEGNTVLHIVTSLQPGQIMRLRMPRQKFEMPINPHSWLKTIKPSSLPPQLINTIAKDVPVKYLYMSN
ncbi:hypothetical protein ACSBR2_007974 [Camellia fascicularis]